MIQFTQITATDTFSYRKQVFTFEDGLHSISGVNGSSKTSLFLAIQQALFNKNAKGSKIEDCSNSITGNPYEIELEFTKGSDEYRVVNSRKTGKIDLFKNGKNIALRKIPEVLKQIQETLGCDYELFADLTYQSKESKLNLLDSSTNKGRSEFVNRILKLDDLDAELTRLNDRRKSLEGKNGRITQLQDAIESLEGSLAIPVPVPEEVEEDESVVVRLRAELEALLQKQTSLSDEYKNLSIAAKKYEEQADKHYEIADIQSQIEVISNQDNFDIVVTVSGLNDTIAGLKILITEQDSKLQEQAKSKVDFERRQSLEANLAAIKTPDKPLDECLEQKAKIEKAYAVKTEQIRSKKVELKKLENASKLGVCPTCTSVVDPTHFEEGISTLGNEVEELDAFCEKCSSGLVTHNDRISVWSQINKINTEITKIPDSCYSASAVKLHQAHKDELLEKLVDYEKDCAAWKEWLAADGRNKTRLKKIEALKADVEVLDAPDQDRLMWLRVKLSDCQQIIAGCRAQIIEAEDIHKEAVKHNAERRTKIAVNAQIEASNKETYLRMDRLKKEFTEAQEKLDLLKLWVSILGPKGYRTQMVAKFLNALNTTMQHYSGLMCDGRINCTFKLSETGEIVFEITDEAKVQDISLWSGGETARIKIVCLFAVLEMLEVMGSTSFNVICLDEIFSALDQEGKEGLFKVLEYLKQKNKAIYVIAHEELTLDLMYDSVIKAEKLSDGTTRLLQ